MPSATSSPLFDGLQSMETIAWANLVTIDLAEFDTPGGKQKLANQIKESVRTSGFFAVKNFGVSKEAIERQIQLSKAIFDLPLEEKLLHHDAAAWARGERVGYRPIGSALRKIQFQGRHRDNVQVWNIEKVDGFHDRTHPPPLQDAIKDTETFQREVNEKVVQRAMQLLAIILELPDENQLAKSYDFANKGEDLLRFLKYDAIPIEDSGANGGISAAKHTDLGTLTLNFRQPVAGLQILDGDGQWKRLKPWEDEIVVNTGDAMSALTGGYFKSRLHRVHAPPKEQIHLDRCSVLWFARPNSSFMMNSLKDSPVLRGGNFETWEGIDQGLNGVEWNQVWMAHLKKQDAIEAEKKQKELEAR